MSLTKNSLILASVLAAVSLQAASVTVNSSSAVNIRSGSTNPTSPTAEFVLVGQTAANEKLRSLFSFDFSDSGIDFNNVTISKVTVNLTINKRDEGLATNVDRTLNLHQLTESYTPLEATWVNAATGTPWTKDGANNPGGTYASEILASVTANPTTVVRNEVLSFTSDALLNLVTNAGLSGNSLDLLLLATPETSGQRTVFYIDRLVAIPSITIEYTPIPEPGHVGLAIGAAALGLIVLRRRAKRS